MSSPPGRTARRLLPRSLRFWARHLPLLQVVLFSFVWLLYGSLALHGYGRDYYARATDFWLERDPQRFERTPGIENVLVPAAGAFAAKLAANAGAVFSEPWFALLTIVPYVLFVAGLTWILGTGSTRSPAARGDPVLACGAAIAMYTSGFVPYMTSWGGYVDGASYLLLLPVLRWPNSVAVYAATFVLQCLNHYLGAVSLLLLAFVRHAAAPMRHAPAAGTTVSPAAIDDGARDGARRFLLEAIVSAIVLGAFLWFWNAYYPDAARVRQQIALDKWSDPAAVLREVLGPFPWTLLSALKLTIVPVAALMLAPLPGRRMRALAVATPFVAATAMTLVFVDVTRVTTLLVMPALLVTFMAARDTGTDAATRRRLRRLLLATAVLNLLVPNYYVNNGELHVPPSVLIGGALENVFGD